MPSNAHILLLLRNGFDATLCSRRWLQFRCLEKSGGCPVNTEITAITASDASLGGEHDGRIFPIAAIGCMTNGDSVVAAKVDTRTVRVAPQMDATNIHSLLQEIGHLIVGLKDKGKKHFIVELW
jgi:hypothetical protein